MKNIGDKTKFGTITGITFKKERYYFIEDKHGTISLMPAYVVEDK